MSNFQFTFEFQGKKVEAHADVIKIADGEIQYFCHSLDDTLNKLYATQLIHYFASAELAYQYGFPDVSFGSHEYMHALATGLRDHIWDAEHVVV
jgi:hypothetical protein